MKEALAFLKKSRVFYLATADSEGPHLRPFGAAVEYEGRIWYCTGSGKAVYRQLQADPRAEIACVGEGGQWLRIRGRAVFAKDDGVKEAIFAEYPMLRPLYEGRLEFATFYLESPLAELHAMDGSIDHLAEY